MQIFETVIGQRFLETFNRKCPEMAHDLASIKKELRLANVLKIRELVSNGKLTEEEALAIIKSVDEE